MRREYRIGKCYADFGNDINWIIEIDGTAFHRDVVADFDREVYMREFIRARSRGLEDLRIMRIGAPRVYNDSARLQRDVLKFLLA